MIDLKDCRMEMLSPVLRYYSNIFLERPGNTKRTLLHPVRIADLRQRFERGISHIRSKNQYNVTVSFDF